MSRARSWRFPSPYPAASTLALALASTVDVVLIPGPRTPRFLFALVSLVLACGTLHGLAWHAVQLLLRRVPRGIGRFIWPLATLFAATFVASRLHAFARLGGRYNALALYVLGACGVGALALGALLAAMQPSATGSLGSMSRLSPRLRLGVSLALVACAVVLGYADRRLFATAYPLAHSALRFNSLWLVMFALVLADVTLRLPRISRTWLVLLAMMFASCFVTVRETASSTLQAFAIRPWPALVLAAAREAIDFDRDGYASGLGGGDCAPFDPRINPGAREIPDNGIDENCMLGDAKRHSSEVEPLTRASGEAPLDIVLITIDTLRPDHLGIYNPRYRASTGGRPTSPNLDRWAENATVFRRAYTSGGWTSIALASLMRGLYGRRLHWTRYYETNFVRLVRSPKDPRLAQGGEVIAQLFPFAYLDPHKTLPQRLQERGMYTLGVVDDGPSEMLQRGHGVELGFDSWHLTDDLPPEQRDDGGTTRLALSALDAVPDHKRFFLWVHYFGPHQPDDIHPGAPQFGRDRAEDRYDHELAYLDLQLQPLLAALARRVPAPAVLIMADHGELFTGGGRLHGLALDEGSIRIPLLARVPDWPRGDVERLTSLVDIMPTVLALTRTPAPKGLDGIDLDPLLERHGTDARILLTDSWRYEPNGSPSIELLGAYDLHGKLILDRVNQSLLAYDAGDGLMVPPPPATRRLDARYRAIERYLEETGGQLNLSD